MARFGSSRVATIRAFLSRLPSTEIEDAIEIAFGRIFPNDENDYRTWKYFCGICWQKIRAKETPCPSN